jgi:hypothetical protein
MFQLYHGEKKINVKENRRGNQEWTIQIHWQCIWIVFILCLCVPNVASVSGLSSSCVFVYPMLPAHLDCLRPVSLYTQCYQGFGTVFALGRYTGNIGYTRHGTKTVQIHWEHWVYKDTGRRQSRYTGNIGYTKTQDEDSPDTLATMGTQDTGRRQTKHKNTTQKTKKMSCPLRFLH